MCVCVWKTKQRKRRGAVYVDYLPQAQDLAMNAFAVLASKCAEEDANASRQLAAHSPVCLW